MKAEPDELKELGQFKAFEGKTWNHPVVAHGKLFSAQWRRNGLLRTDGGWRKITSFGKGPQPAASTKGERAFSLLPNALTRTQRFRYPRGRFGLPPCGGIGGDSPDPLPPVPGIGKEPEPEPGIG